MDKLHIILKIGMLMLANYKNLQNKLNKNLLKVQDKRLIKYLESKKNQLLELIYKNWEQPHLK